MNPFPFNVNVCLYNPEISPCSTWHHRCEEWRPGFLIDQLSSPLGGHLCFLILSAGDHFFLYRCRHLIL